MIIHLPNCHLHETAPDERNPIEKSITTSPYIGFICCMECVELLGASSVNFSSGKFAM